MVLENSAIESPADHRVVGGLAGRGKSLMGQDSYHDLLGKPRADSKRSAAEVPVIPSKKGMEVTLGRRFLWGQASLLLRDHRCAVKIPELDPFSAPLHAREAR